MSGGSVPQDFDVGMGSRLSQAQKRSTKGLMAPVPHPERGVPGIQLPSKHQLRDTDTNHCVFCMCVFKGFLKHQVCSKRKFPLPRLSWEDEGGSSNGGCRPQPTAVNTTL